MLENIIKYNDCAKCKFCCRFTKTNLWDVPLFTEGQKAMYSHISFQKHRGLWTPQLIEESLLYICPFLDASSGCVLGKLKPFDCNLWPFYVMKKDSRIFIVSCDYCPAVNKIDCEKQLSTLYAYRDNIWEICQKYPGYIGEYKNGFQIIFEI